VLGVRNLKGILRFARKARAIDTGDPTVELFNDEGFYGSDYGLSAESDA
jgi:hypothetical protein